MNVKVWAFKLFVYIATAIIGVAGIRALYPASWIEEYDGNLNSFGDGAIFITFIIWVGAISMASKFSDDDDDKDIPLL